MRRVNVKKYWIYCFLLISFCLLTSCREKRHHIRKHNYPYIGGYIVNPYFTAGREYYEYNNKELVKICIYPNVHGPYGVKVVLNMADEKDEFMAYAKRYNDLDYQGEFGPYYERDAFAEPLSKVRCYEQSSDGTYFDISDKLIFISETAWPYIHSGYNSSIFPIYDHSLDYGGKYPYKYYYIVRKKLTELTLYDTTLINNDGGTGPIILIAEEPYKISVDKNYKIAFDYGDKPYELEINS